jgi:hypothetical protein
MTMFTQPRQIDVVQVPSSKAAQMARLSHLDGTDHK